jgi:hypothetical protein
MLGPSLTESEMKKLLALALAPLTANVALQLADRLIPVAHAQEAAVQAPVQYKSCEPTKVMEGERLTVGAGQYVAGYGFGGAQSRTCGMVLLCTR